MIKLAKLPIELIKLFQAHFILGVKFIKIDKWIISLSPNKASKIDLIHPINIIRHRSDDTKFSDKEKKKDS